MKALIFFAVLLIFQCILGSYAFLMGQSWGSTLHSIGNELYILHPYVFIGGVVYIFVRKRDLNLFMLPLSFIPPAIANFLYLQFGNLGIGGLTILFNLVYLEFPLFLISLICAIVFERKKRKGHICQQKS